MPPVPDTATDVVPLFARHRLRLARETRGMTQTQLAAEVTRLATENGGDGLTSAALSQFEKGDVRPTERRIESIAAALNFPVGFFATSQAPSSLPNGDLDALDTFGHFRAQRSVTAKQRRSALAVTELVRDISNELAQHVHLPEPHVPHLAVPADADAAVARSGSSRNDPIELTAQQVRQLLNVSAGPLNSVVELLQNMGIVVARHANREREIHAYSAAFPDRPVVVLGADGTPRDRDRFSAAHELGHLVMHRAEERLAPRLVEDQANRFAAALLMPTDDITDELPERSDWSTFQALKQRWGVSMGALVRRSWTVGRMSDIAYQRAAKTIGARGWRLKEPGDVGQLEPATLLTRAAEHAKVDAVSLSAATGWPCSLIEGLLSQGRDPRPHLTREVEAE